MIETETVLSPGWWLNRLYSKLLDGIDRYDMLDQYYRNEWPLSIPATKAVREAYQRLMAIAKTNYAELVVEAVRERMMPTAFRTGARGDENGDDAAWQIWQGNDLDADSLLNHRNSLAMGMGYVIVGPVEADTGVPLITIEDPREVYAEMDPQRKRRPLAAVKMIRDTVNGVWSAWLYLPDGVHHAVGRVPMDTNWGAGAPPFLPTEWAWEGDVVQLVEDQDFVPVVPFPNRPDSFGRTLGEFEPHLPILDRINYSILNRLEIATLQAFRQRAIKGVPATTDTGEQIDYDDIFAADPGSLWLIPETAELWESGQVDLNPMRQAIRDDVMDLAAVTRTPLFYLTPDATNGSAEGASLAREGLIFKTGDRIVQAGEGWERVMALAFTIAGDDQRASAADMQVIWAPPERYSLAERYDAASKAQAAGVTWRESMRSVLQFDPQTIARMEAERAAEQLLSDGLGGDEGPSDLEQLKGRTEVFAALVRAGATPETAATVAGLAGLEFLAATPVTLKMTAEPVGGGFGNGAPPPPAALPPVPPPPPAR